MNRKNMIKYRIVIILSLIFISIGMGLQYYAKGFKGTFHIFDKDIFSLYGTIIAVISIYGIYSAAIQFFTGDNKKHWGISRAFYVLNNSVYHKIISSKFFLFLFLVWVVLPFLQIVISQYFENSSIGMFEYVQFIFTFGEYWWLVFLIWLIMLLIYSILVNINDTIVISSEVSPSDKMAGYKNKIDIEIENLRLEQVKDVLIYLNSDKCNNFLSSFKAKHLFNTISRILEDMPEVEETDFIQQSIIKINDILKNDSVLSADFKKEILRERWDFINEHKELLKETNEIEYLINNDTALLNVFREHGYRIDKSILENKWKSFEKNTIRFDNYIKMVLNEFEAIRQPNNDKQIWSIFINFSNDLIQSIFEHEDFDLKTLVEELLDFQFKKVVPDLKGNTNFIHFKIWKKVFDKLSESPDLDNIFPKDGEFEVTDGTEEVLRKTFSEDVVAFIYSYSAISYLILFNNRLNEYFSNKLYESLREYQKKFMIIMYNIRTIILMRN